MVSLVRAAQLGCKFAVLHQQGSLSCEHRVERCIVLTLGAGNYCLFCGFLAGHAASLRVCMRMCLREAARAFVMRKHTTERSQLYYRSVCKF